MRLPHSYWRRLQRVGLDLTDFDEREKFELLNREFSLDDAIRKFASLRPELPELAKDFLSGGLEPVAVKPPVLDNYSLQLQSHVQDSLAAWRER